MLGFFRLHLANIGLSLSELDPMRQADAFRDSRIDLGIFQGLPLDGERWLHGESVYSEPVVLAVPESHRLAGKVRFTLASLAEEAFVLFPRQMDPVLHDDIIAGCRASRVSPRVVQEATGWHTLVTLVGAGVGIGIVPRSVAQLQQPGVRYRAIPGLTVEMSLLAVWKSGERSPVRERFVTALRAVAGARMGATRR